MLFSKIFKPSPGRNEPLIYPVSYINEQYCTAREQYRTLLHHVSHTDLSVKEFRWCVAVHSV